MWVKTRGGETHIYVHFPVIGEGPHPLYINIHGGGFVKGHKKRDTLLCRKIAHTLNCAVLDIDYKIAPEERFPYALHECYDIVKWAYNNPKLLNIDSKRIAVGGHSAGGTLTAGLAMMANKTKEFSIILQILDYPPLDLYTDPILKKSSEQAIPVDRARAYNDLYIDESDRNNPLASPVYASVDMLKGLPPALVLTAELDSLCEEAEKYAAMMIEAGVPVTTRRFLGSEHGFLTMCKAGYAEAEKMIIDALKNAFI
jgi:acetyl esterase